MRWGAEKEEGGVRMREAAEAIGVAFGMFSRIPVPAQAFSKNGMASALAAFPLVGLVQGLLVVAWGVLARWLELPAVLTAGVLCVIPVLVNGGIHLDGLCDTADALASYAPREKRLEILKDPRAGAFGVIAVCVYFVLQFSLYASAVLDVRALAAVGASMVLSRALSGLAVELLPNARVDGMVAGLSPAKRRVGVAAPLTAFGVAAAGAMIACSGVVGACAVVVALGVLAWYRHMALAKFGGVTGDLAGWFLQWVELAMLAVVVLGELLW